MATVAAQVGTHPLLPRHFRHLLAFLFLLSWTPIGAAAPEGPWLSHDERGQPQVHLYFFWSPTCPHCRAAKPFVIDLPQRLPWLVLHSHDVTERGHAQAYVELAAGLGETARSVPAFLFCSQMVVGYGSDRDSGAALERALRACHAANGGGADPETARMASTPGATPLPGDGVAGDRVSSEEVPGEGRTGPGTTNDTVPGNGVMGDGRTGDKALSQGTTGHGRMGEEVPELPFLGRLDPAAVSLPVYTLVIAGLDAFNPCAFFVLLFLLSLLVHARSRARMLFIGGVFVLFSGLIYFLFMAAWLNLFLWLGELRLVTLGAGVLAVLVALVNIKDYFWFRRGPSLSIPDGAKPGLYQRMRGLLRADSLPALTLGTVALAIVANSYELLCTAGFPMIYTRILTLAGLSPLAHYLYLGLYNLIYVVPLLVIVLIFARTLGGRKLSEAEGRVLKLVSGLMMLGLGTLLLVAPGALNDPLAALALLGLAVGLTWVIHRLMPREEGAE